MRYLRSAWIYLVGGLIVLCWLPLLAAIRLFDRDSLHRRTGRWFRRVGRVLSRIYPWKLNFSGFDALERRVYVIVSNHQSLADIPVLSHLRLDTKWLGKAELLRVPVFGWMMRLAGDVGVNRSDRRQGARALLRCAAYLRAGCSVVFFPEGTRSPDGQIGAFNDGPFQLAIRERVPVLPLIVDGTGALLPRDALSFGSHRDLYLHALDPVPVEGMKVSDTAALRDLTHKRMAAALENLRAGSPAKIEVPV